MTEQRTPDELTAENELICEKLLGWTSDSYIEGRKWPWLDRHGNRRVVTPTFTDWASAGLILEAMASRGLSIDISHTQTEDGQMKWGVVYWLPKRMTVDADSAPLAIRTAALNYIRSLP